MTWSRFCGQASGKAFVPKGLDEGSQAIYCLGCKKRDPSRRARYDLVEREGSSTLIGEPLSRPTQTVPYGTDLFVNIFQAVNCQATFIQSLRDEARAPVYILTPHNQSVAQIEDEDDDEYENDKA